MKSAQKGHNCAAKYKYKCMKCLKSPVSGGIFKIHKRSEDIFKNHLNHLLWLATKIHYSSAGNSCNQKPLQIVPFFVFVVKEIAVGIGVSSIMWHGVVKKKKKWSYYGGSSHTSLV